MQKAARGRPLHSCSTANYFVALAAIAAEVAADEAASIAEEAAIIDDVAAAEAAEVSAGGVVTMVVVDGDGTGIVVVVVVSSFLVQAAKETAAARVTINNAVFIFLLDLGFGTMTVAIVGSLSRGAPSFKDKESKGIPVPNPRL